MTRIEARILGALAAKKDGNNASVQRAYKLSVQQKVLCGDFRIGYIVFMSKNRRRVTCAT